MADRRLSAARRLSTAVRVRYRLTPWWLKVMAVFAVSRVVTTSILLFYAARQESNAWTGANPDYFDFAKMWDGHWYYIIAVAGYPTELPVTDDGYVGENAWAFMPAFPAIVRLLMFATGASYSVLAVVVSVGFALAAALMFFKLMRLVLPGGTALFAVVLFCFAPLSPILQVAYAESMQLFLLALALYLLVQRRYWIMLPVIAVMALTRPSGLAFAFTMLLHVGWRWWRRGHEPFPVGERVASVVVGLFSAFMGVAWLLIAAAVTGSLTAYTDTELAWRSAYVGHGELLPFTPWVQAAGFWAPWFGMPLPLLLVLLTLGVAAFFGALFLPAVRRLGPDIRFWLASYALYLLAVFFPQSSTFRLLMPLFPALGAVAQPRSPWYRVGIVALFIAGQVAWVHIAWWVNGYDWSPP
ncbi:mannosyltransferase family protein [Leifsonia sp. H3M29-4]|uniref:mannosyltransferase family protein n=1 Tax=Salinibacterium metalliresistens TaxID=3031321 RepID=UPI0023DC1048|nr:mannosyltransferase family protein [Salinibacterium metalliresistens]MDF1479519.1 mannosyltransferase family protein [Salinibacterium metalliresistens]